MKSTVRALIHISRPRFWVYTWGSYVVGVAAGAHDFQDIYEQFLLILLSVIILTFISNLFIFGINDYFDKDTDIYNSQKKRGYESNILEVNQRVLVISIIVAFSILFIFAISQPTITSRAIMALSIISAIIYSAPPLRLKSRPIIDSLSNFSYILPILLGYNHVSGELPSFPVLIALGAWSVAMHLFSAIPDIDADRKASLKTSALIFGERISLLICFILWSIFSLIHISTETDFFTLLLLLYPIIPILLIFIRIDDLFKIYKIFPAINGLLGFSAFIYFVVHNLFL